MEKATEIAKGYRHKIAPKLYNPKRLHEMPLPDISQMTPRNILVPQQSLALPLECDSGSEIDEQTHQESEQGFPLNDLFDSEYESEHQNGNNVSEPSRTDDAVLLTNDSDGIVQNTPTNSFAETQQEPEMPLSELNVSVQNAEEIDPLANEKIKEEDIEEFATGGLDDDDTLSCILNDEIKYVTWDEDVMIADIPTMPKPHFEKYRMKPNDPFLNNFAFRVDVSFLMIQLKNVSTLTIIFSIFRIEYRAISTYYQSKSVEYQKKLR